MSYIRKPRFVGEKKHYTALINVMRFGRVLLGLSIFIPGVFIIGHLLNLPELYAPFPHITAISPITAVTIVALAAGFMIPLSGKNKIYIRLLSLGAMAIAITKLITFYYIDINLFSTYNPVLKQLWEILNDNNDYLVGINTAYMIIIYSVGLLLYSFSNFFTMQLFISLALIIPSISMTGYLFSVSKLYGQMSFLTMLSGYAIGFGSLSKTARYGIVRIILSDNQVGKIARMQLIFGFMFTFGAAYFLHRVLQSNESDIKFTIYIIIVCWFIFYMITFSTIILYLSERKNKKYERSLYDAARIDPLTSLLNRRGFNEEIHAALRRQARYGGDICLLMIDIDFFKRINDRFGHSVGDIFIKTTAKIIEKNIRCTDIVCRHDGEEFVVALPKTTLSQGTIVALKLNRKIAQIDFSSVTGGNYTQTVSIGCSVIKKESPDIHKALVQTDNALYQAKNTGRNKVVIYEENKYKS